MVKYLYNLVMDPERNPLQALPKMVRFQYMVILAYMWSVVFSIYLGTIAVLGPSISCSHDPADRRVLHRRHLPARTQSLAELRRAVPGPGGRHGHVR